MSFEKWMARVDFHVSSLVGVSVHDLADFYFRDYFDDGVSPEETAREVIENDDLYCHFPLD